MWMAMSIMAVDTVRVVNVRMRDMCLMIIEILPVTMSRNEIELPLHNFIDK